MSKNLEDRLIALADIHRERGAVYGDDYKHVGEVLAGLFPRGLTLNTPEQFRRMALFVMEVTKLSRYAQCMARGEWHADSQDDLSLYAQMIRETDEEGG